MFYFCLFYAKHSLVYKKNFVANVRVYFVFHSHYPLIFTYLKVIHISLVSSQVLCVWLVLEKYSLC